MRALPGGEVLDAERVRFEVEARDREIDNDFTKDAQIAMLRSARAYRGDRLIRTATPHRILDPKAGPLIAVKLHVLTRKSLGGIETDLTPARWHRAASRSPACMPRARRAASAAAACTAIARWRARSSADACSPAAWPAARPRPPSRSLVAGSRAASRGRR